MTRESLEKLITQWETIDAPLDLHHCVVRTAAILSAFEDVDETVLDDLTEVAGKDRGRRVFAVVKELRDKLASLSKDACYQ